MVKNRTLVLNQAALNIMRKHAVKAYPEECCGFLWGTQIGNRYVVKYALAVPNRTRLNKRLFFKISYQDYMAAERFAEKSKLVLFGIFHSHPDHPAYPSMEDCRFALPNFAYIIISVKHSKVADMKCWQLNEQTCLFKESLTFIA